MAIDLAALRSELDTDPLVRGYAGMTDPQVADDMNTPYRDGPADRQAILQYATLERYRAGTIYGRLQLVAGARPIRAGVNYAIAPLPLGAGDSDVTPTQQQIASAQSFLRYLDVDTAGTITLLDGRVDTILDNLTEAGGGIGVMGGNDKTNIQALSQNQQTRSLELFMTIMTSARVTQARAI